MAKSKLTDREKQHARGLQRTLGYRITDMCKAVFERDKTKFEKNQFDIYQMIDDLEQMGKWD